MGAPHGSQLAALPRTMRRLALLLFGVLRVGSLARAAVPAKLTLGHITPFSGAWSGGLQMEAGVIMGLEDVNAATAILPDTKLGRIVKDSKCEAGLGMRSFIGTTRRVGGVVERDRAEGGGGGRGRGDG